jgi:D-glycero-D-manno-heptose 1,7-bisphosphate phosphatase
LGVKKVNQPAVFLDRDGVLNASFVRDGTTYPPAGVREVQILPGVPQALAVLKKLGFLLVVVTNQPDIARGMQTAAEVEAINRHLSQSLPLDDIRVCPHDNADNCDCRKPKPGMLLAAAAEHGIDLHTSFMVGDRIGDVAAGAAAGCRTFLVQGQYNGTGPQSPDFTVRDLAEAADVIGRLMNSR